MSLQRSSDNSYSLYYFGASPKLSIGLVLKDPCVTSEVTSIPAKDIIRIVTIFILSSIKDVRS